MSDDTVAFLGMKQITPKEREQLTLLGRLLARADGELHTAMTEGANMAVIDGFRAGGKQPVLHQSKLHEASPWMLLYGDDRFMDAILSRWPEPPPNTRHWDWIHNVEELAALNVKISTALRNRAAATQ